MKFSYVEQYFTPTHQFKKSKFFPVACKFCKKLEVTTIFEPLLLLFFLFGSSASHRLLFLQHKGSPQLQLENIDDVLEYMYGLEKEDHISKILYLKYSINALVRKVDKKKLLKNHGRSILQNFQQIGIKN